MMQLGQGQVRILQRGEIKCKNKSQSGPTFKSINVLDSII